MKAPAVRITCLDCEDVDYYSSEEHGQDVRAFYQSNPERCVSKMSSLLQYGSADGIDPSTGHRVTATILS